MDREAVEHMYQVERGTRDRMLTLLDSLLVMASSIEREEEGASSAEGREISLLGLTLVSLCIAIGILLRNVRITPANYRAISTVMKATCQILDKLPLGENVYHNLLDHVLRSLRVRVVPHPTATEISPKMSTQSSIHGVLHNLAIKLTSEVLGLLDFDDSNFENSKLGSILESLNCTLGSLNRALDPLPGGKYAMEGELYNVHLTPHKSLITTTRISEPKVTYCCSGHRQLTMR